MRPVNLIPPEQRRGERAPLRSGPLPYMLVAALALALLAVTGVVLVSNQVAEREAEIASLEVREADARARARSLNAFAEFASLSEARFATVTSLADSRFDWERVLRELALVLPDDIWLVDLTASASPETAVEGADVSLRAEASGPALSMIGCGRGQAAVAGFVKALEDIDGVTRVGVASSELPGGGGEAGGAGGGDGDDCRTRDFISRFEIVAAFDAVEIAVPEPPSPDPPSAPSTDDGAVAEAPEGQDSNESGAVAGVAR